MHVNQGSQSGSDCRPSCQHASANGGDVGEHQQLARRGQLRELGLQALRFARAQRLERVDPLWPRQPVEVADPAPVGELDPGGEVTAASVAPAVDADEGRRVGEADRAGCGQPSARGACALPDLGDRGSVEVVVAEHEVERGDAAQLFEQAHDVTALRGIARDQDEVRLLPADGRDEVTDTFLIEEVEMEVGEPGDPHVGRVARTRAHVGQAVL
jgi:hypothetical protein